MNKHALFGVNELELVLQKKCRIKSEHQPQVHFSNILSNNKLWSLLSKGYQERKQANTEGKCFREYQSSKHKTGLHKRLPILKRVNFWLCYFLMLFLI